jgi:hypothetical protein
LSLWLGVNFRVLRIVENPRNAEHIAEAATASPLIVGPGLLPKGDRDQEQRPQDRAASRALSAGARWHTIPFVPWAIRAELTASQLTRSLSGRPPKGADVSTSRVSKGRHAACARPLKRVAIATHGGSQCGPSQSPRWNNRHFRHSFAILSGASRSLSPKSLWRSQKVQSNNLVFVFSPVLQTPLFRPAGC